jgi:predicted ester cyclase
MERTAANVVKDFILHVRSGNAPETALNYMSATVIAHQVISGAEHIIQRTPQDYSEHIHEFLACYGQYQLQIEELIAQDNKVYVRWQQVGTHQGEISGYAPTGLPLTTVGSAVYLVNDGLITEYWIQQENQGLLAQLRNNRND